MDEEVEHPDPLEGITPHHNLGRRKPSPFVCSKCKNGDCEQCIDVLRSVVSDVTICKCKKAGHDGEPVEQQVRDPFTDSVHGPGMEVTSDGDVRPV